LDEAAGRIFSPDANELNLKNAHAFLLVYSIERRHSFESLGTYIEKVKRVRCCGDGDDGIKFAIAGNKVDLQEQREVGTDELVHLGRVLGVPVFETSAKTCVNVEQAFHAIAREVMGFEDGQCQAQPKRQRVCTIL
jgi:GTPase SAR1 family protein